MIEIQRSLDICYVWQHFISSTAVMTALSNVDYSLYLSGGSRRGLAWFLALAIPGADVCTGNHELLSVEQDYYFALALLRHPSTVSWSRKLTCYELGSQVDIGKGAWSSYFDTNNSMNEWMNEWLLIWHKEDSTKPRAVAQPENEWCGLFLKPGNYWKQGIAMYG